MRHGICLLIAVIPILLLGPARGQGPPGPSPTVYLGNITFTPQEPLEGENVEIETSITSNNSLPLSNLTAHLYVDQVEVGNISGFELGPGQVEELSFQWTAEKWTHVVAITVDRGGIPLGNAAASSPITVEAKPVGNVETLVGILAGIGAFVVGITIAPSIINRLRRKPS